MLLGYVTYNAYGIALYAVRAILGGLLSTQANVNTVGETVYSATITAKGAVATTKQVVKPSQLIGYEDPGETVYFGKLTTKKYQAVLAYKNDGTGRPQQTYAVAWDPTAKKPLGLIGADMVNASDPASGFLGGVANFGNTALDIASLIKPGLVGGKLESVPAILSAVSAFLTPGPITPDSALFSGSAAPFTVFDGWSGYGQKGENFRSGLTMVWVDKGLRDGMRAVFGGKSLADVATRVMDLFVGPNGVKTPEIIDAVLDILGEFPELAKDGSQIGCAVGYGQGTMNFDKKTQTAVISGANGQAIVLDKSSSDIPYETWNIYTGRSFSALFADLTDLTEEMMEDGLLDNADWSEIPEALQPVILNLIPNAPGLLKLMMQREAFGGYGTYSIKLVKGAGDKIAAADGADARIEAFLKAGKAPKYVTAEDVIDCRANYLSYMFNGRTARPAVIELPRATFLSEADQQRLSAWEQENLKEEIGNKDYEQIMIPLWPMTPENVLVMTGKILSRFEDGENYISYNADFYRDAPRLTGTSLGKYVDFQDAFDFCLFGSHLYDGKTYVSASGLGDAVKRSWYVHDLILGALERSSIGREYDKVTYSSTYVTADRQFGWRYYSPELYLKVLEDAGYDGTTSFAISGLEGIKALFAKAAEKAATRLDTEKKANEAEWKAGGNWRYTSYAAYKLIIQAIEGMEMIRDSKVKVLNADAQEARAMGIR